MIHLKKLSYVEKIYFSSNIALYLCKVKHKANYFWKKQIKM